MEKRCKFVDLKQEEIVSRTSYMKITGKNEIGVRVKNLAGTEWQINGADIIEDEVTSPSQYDEVIELSKGELAKHFVTVPGDVVFTVYFETKEGKDRLLVGIRSPKDDTNNVYLGYSLVIDLEKEFEGQRGFRTVDHDKIQWFICKNKKYVRK